MNNTTFTREDRSARSVAPQTPFQTPAIDRTPAMPRGSDGGDRAGVEADGWEDVLSTIGSVAKFFL
ncbi:hypothetical protein [Streptomyces sp. NPDC047000]|uniref:hypothetical protein n=1 Tax=Streptomyces sp. NPDC047000 TaxID=3155474 RepID=UPI0033ED5536